jgi:mannose-6-phosphate isomerase-like protein (cupin superfamily)
MSTVSWREYPSHTVTRDKEEIMATPSEGLVLGPGEGDVYQLRAGPLTIKASSEQTNGSVTVWEDTVLPATGPPLHIHHKCDELFNVLEGRFTFVIGNSQSEAPSGSFVFVPRGMTHTYRNIGDEPGKLFNFVVPSLTEAIDAPSLQPSLS